MGCRVEDDGKSEGYPVMGWIGIESDQEYPARKRANFHRVFRYEST